MHMVVQFERALFPQLQSEHRGERLGHGEDAPDRVGLHRKRCLDIAVSVRGEVNELAVAAHGYQPARQPSVVDVPTEMGIDAFETLGRHADVCSVGFGLQ